MNITGEIKILKDDRGIYKTTLMGREINKETDEEEKIFMQVNVGFRKGVEVKNKTRINVKEGFISIFRIETGELKDDGTPAYKYFPKFIIMDFDVIEEGIDEVNQYRNQNSSKTDFDNDSMGYYSSSDELPF